ncbi:hypothetical protein [Verrucomicrobium spinosum]|uniref:hypothetical protein n=1 Tax=Verrucomicrobium spinosum TaxID=2736 RepID=UPI0009466516|nr:hypothetical protein [Verrucomicrobium spinosum]
MAAALKVEGHVAGVFFIDPEMDPGETGPPFGISPEELTGLWEEAGFRVQESWVHDRLFGPGGTGAGADRGEGGEGGEGGVKS